jgi:hypothetical protein
LGHAFKLAFSDTMESNDGLAPDDPERMFFPQVEYIFPFAILCGVMAFCIWVIFMKTKPTKIRGVFAGLTTVFIAYPFLGFAVGLFFPDLNSFRLFSAVSSAIELTLFGNVLTFWFTYTLGAICGFLIAKRMLRRLATDKSAPSVFD